MTSTQSHKPSGAGLGLRRELISELNDAPVSNIDFFEIAPENWLHTGGRHQEILREFTQRFPFACHGLSLSIGSADPLDTEFLLRIRKFLDDHNIELYTEHLSWCSYNGHLYDLLPIPFTYESAKWVAARVRQVQDILQRQISLENASFYLKPPQSDMNETDFIRTIIEESDCGLHLDVNNVYVNSTNFNYDPINYIEALPLDRVNYLHVAGHYVEQDGFIIDTHGANVKDSVWDLLDKTYSLLGDKAPSIPTCLERDFNFPELSSLLTEVDQIHSLQNKYSTSEPNALGMPSKTAHQ